MGLAWAARWHRWGYRIAQYAADDISASGAVAAVGRGVDLRRSAGRFSRWLERLKRARRERVTAGQTQAPRRMPLFLAAIVVSFYVGYFGAGAGFVFMTLLALFGYEDIHEINALKVVANLMANGIAFVIFIVDGQVVWRYCLAAMIAAAIGGYVSASLAKRVPQPVLRGAGGGHRPSEWRRGSSGKTIHSLQFVVSGSWFAVRRDRTAAWSGQL